MPKRSLKNIGLQQAVKEILTSKTTKATTQTNQTTQASSKAPMEATATGSSTPMEGLLANGNNTRPAANLADPGKIKLLNPPKHQDTRAWSKELLKEMDSGSQAWTHWAKPRRTLWFN
ncbi:hypothetical protein PtB15_12B181 [Puccinia triticina]|nr:hypothetical protein PtB15_12B181 [Puccinia triticina]